MERINNTRNNSDSSVSPLGPDIRVSDSPSTSPGDITRVVADAPMDASNKRSPVDKEEVQLISMFYEPGTKLISLARVMSFMCLICSFVFAMLECYVNPGEVPDVALVFLTAAFCPKLLKTLVSGRFAAMIGKGGVQTPPSKKPKT